jgi:malate dehydrogenase
MASVAVIGAGELGGAVAQALATGDRVARVLLVDARAGVAVGKALDLQQSGPVTGFHTQLAGTDDLSRVMGASVCVIADRAGPPLGEWSDDEGLALLRRLLPSMGDVPIVFAGAAQTGLILTASREHHLPRARLIGSAAEAYAAAMRAMVSLEAGCSPSEVSLAVLGLPPSGLVVPWSEAAIGGFGLERVLTPVQLTRLEARSARLWPPGPYALGMAAARAAESVIHSSRRAISVLTVLDGEYGVRRRVGALPALLDGRGIAQVHEPALSTRERVLLETALGA